jgi:ABC-type sugar transport system permease subunit
MAGVVAVVGNILLVGLTGSLILLLSIIVSKKTPATLGWTIATVAMGVIPGITAALLYRYKDVSAGKAFTVAVRGLMAFSSSVVGILWSLGVDP